MSKAIPIINPNTSEVINLSARVAAKEANAVKEAAAAKEAAANAIAAAAKPEEKVFKAPSHAIKIVSPKVSFSVLYQK